MRSSATARVPAELNLSKPQGQRSPCRRFRRGWTRCQDLPEPASPQPQPGSQLYHLASRWRPHARHPRLRQRVSELLLPVEVAVDEEDLLQAVRVNG